MNRRTVPRFLILSLGLATILILALLITAVPGPRFALAAPLALQLPWHTTDSGGGTSSGSTFSLSGTIGQADAGPPGGMSGGSFAVQGGFWAGAGGAAEYPLFLPLVRR